VNLKLNLLLIAALFAILLLTSSCNKTPLITPPFHGDYPAAQLRSMWAFCVKNFQLKAPLTPPFLVGQMCDCYLDEMRAAHPHRRINILSDNETRAMGQKLIKVCNVKPEVQTI